MEWNSIKMSKAEFERLQKEYTAAAIKTAEKAKRSAISKETPVAAQQPAPTAGIIYEASSAIAEATVENPPETESVVNEIADVSEPVVNEAEEIAISPESNDIQISAAATEIDTEEISAEPEPEASENNENTEFNEDNSEMPQDTSDIQQEDEQQYRRPCNGEAAAAGEQEQRAHRRDEQDALGREAPFVHGDGHEDDADGQDHGGVADDGADAVADGHAHLVL